MTITPATASDLLDRYGVAPKRSLGQNFVVDPNTVRRIARLADVGPRDRVIEIGAGLGSLTTALAETGARVLAIEIDGGLIPALKEVVAPYERVKVLHADVTKIDWSSQLDDDRRWVVVANLPYNLATPLVMGFLDEVPAVKRMLVMVQKEVGERFVAIPRTPAYGAVSVKVAYWAEAKIVGLVPPTVFMPKPKVDSALVSIVRRPKPAVPVNVDRDWLFQLVRTGFGQRRKMLRRSLAELVKPMSFERAGISPEARAEELDVYAWGLLASYSPRVAGGRPPPRSARVPDHRRRSRCERGRPAGEREADADAAGHRHQGRRLPPDRRRDGHPRAARRPDDLGRRLARGHRTVRPGMPTDDTNLVRKALRLAGAHGGGAHRQADPARRRARRRLGRCGGGAAVGRFRRPRRRQPAGG